MVGNEWSADHKSPKSVGGKNTQTVHVQLAEGEDIDAHCKRAREAGAEILQEPETQFYGDRTYRARDPEGPYLDLRRHREEDDAGRVGQGERPHHEEAARLNTRIDKTFAALADPHRRHAVELLGQRPRRAGELADALGLPAPAMSRHLRQLKQSGLVEETHPEFDARVRIYALKDGAMAELKRWLAETEAMWAAQLSGFKAHVEKKRK